LLRSLPNYRSTLTTSTTNPLSSPLNLSPTTTIINRTTTKPALTQIITTIITTHLTSTSTIISTTITITTITPPRPILTTPRWT